jgi:Cu+-exporting ATPase
LNENHGFNIAVGKSVMNKTAISESVKCYHCGDDCADDSITSGEKVFCCNGCRLVYDILQENNLCTYYNLNQSPGNKTQSILEKRYSFLDEPAVEQKLLSFRNHQQSIVTFYIPSMHCSSCIWLLENFHKVDDGVISSRVDFAKKELRIVYQHQKTSLRKLVEKLAQTGYEPSLQLDALEQKTQKKANRNRIIRIGVAGFCFGNIMMLSFPEYFSSGKNIDASLQQFFSYMNLILALPVFFFSANEFFIKSYRALRHGSTSIDLPIAIGITAIFLRSAFEILTHSGAGYFDSGSGLVFFMLIGRWFQDFTFDHLSFDRDYKSYFPIAVTTIKNGYEKDVAVNDLKVNDRILIRNNEIIPVDAVLLKGSAAIDYHFVTGESLPIYHHAGENIFAGGRQTGAMIELQVVKEISQSQLTQLWNRAWEHSSISKFEKLVNAISRWFIVVTLIIATAGALYWWHTDMHRAINAFTAVLVIACPCALALSAPFTYGNILRILGRNKIYLRNYHALEKLADADVIVFDKTGTLTQSNRSNITYKGDDLNDYDNKLIASLFRQSSHPLSKMLLRHLASKTYFPCEQFNEVAGQGISGTVANVLIKAGTATWAHVPASEHQEFSAVYINIGGLKKGCFWFQNFYRPGLKTMAEKLKALQLDMVVLTGDNESERHNLTNLLGNAELRFNQKPEDKYQYVNDCCLKNKKVIMIGDGLNDAGALRAAHTGISVTDNTNSFTPGSHVIMDAGQLQQLPALIKLSKSAVTIIIISFIISLIYNFVGLSFAVSGTLSPLLAAILMPISTISLVLFTVLASTIKAKQLHF